MIGSLARRAMGDAGGEVPGGSGLSIYGYQSVLFNLYYDTNYHMIGPANSA